MNEGMRKEFEEWYVDEFRFSPNCSSGMSMHAQSRWEAWQASREAMKPIKLPDFNVFIHSDCWFDGESEHVMEDFDVSECRNFLVEVIQQAGYKVAP